MVLRIEAVSKRFSDGKYGVRDLTLSAEPGVLGLLGPNGAGKTTLLQMIATVTRPSAGCILFDGIDVERRPEVLRGRLGYLPQDFGAYPNLSAFEFLDYVARLKGVRSRRRVLEMLEIVNLHSVAARPVGTFSGGMRQRLGIAQALVSGPDLVIVDEPTAGLDPEERVRFRNVLSDAAGRRLVILSTHIVSDLESVADRIAVVRDGRLVAAGSPEELLLRASGTAWEAVVPPGQLEQIREQWTVSSMNRREDGVHLRLVAGERPFDTARPVPPDLEDAYLLLVRSEANAQRVAVA